MRTTLLVLPLLVCFTASCTTEEGTAPKEPAPAGAKPAANAAEAVVYDVKCGCSIDGIGRCGNYVHIDGKYVPIVHPSLGKMEWCAEKDAGAKIEAVGAMRDGSFVAESWKLVQ